MLVLIRNSSNRIRKSSTIFVILLRANLFPASCNVGFLFNVNLDKNIKGSKIKTKEFIYTTLKFVLLSLCASSFLEYLLLWHETSSIQLQSHLCCGTEIKK